MSINAGSFETVSSGVLSDGLGCICREPNHLLNSHRYPSIDGIELREKIAITHNLDVNRIILGCGSDETLLFAALAFCQDGDEIIHAKHGFEMYSIITKIVGATSKLIEENTDYSIDVKAILKQITPSTKIIYLANPNNPTGTYLSRTEIVNLLNKLPKHIIVVLDGAYAEYVIKDDYDSGFSLTEEFENIIMTRTFSKGFGAAGCRVGMTFSNPHYIENISKFRQMYEITGVSLKYCKFLLDNHHLVDIYCKEVVEEKKKVVSMLKNYEVIDSQCNWIHFNNQDDNKKQKKF